MCVVRLQDKSKINRADGLLSSELLILFFLPFTFVIHVSIITFVSHHLTSSLAEAEESCFGLFNFDQKMATDDK